MYCCTRSCTTTLAQGFVRCGVVLGSGVGNILGSGVGNILGSGVGNILGSGVGNIKL
jgi:hypothetical protein